MTGPELIKEEAAYLENIADQLRARASQLRELGRENQDQQLETKLEALSWKEAASKKCDYAKDVPGELVQAVRATKGGIRGKTHHFTATTDGQTLFRFRRSKT